MRSDPRQLRWCIETRDGHAIGDLGLVDIHPHGRAELAVTIGDKEYWGHGYGTDAIRAALQYAFDHLGCRRVYLITDEDNLRAHRCFEKCGFVREGLLRAHRLRYGTPLNMLIMGALRSESRPA
jgi:ribosomal-protein-alanine N-acetyltransferase